ncbi:MAG: ATP-binding protein [Gemmatimonadota bacterium]
MKELVVVSGKGGTGKTSVVAALATQAGRLVLADCDVDAADLHLVLAPAVQQAHPFSGGKRARVLAETCTGCGTCEEVCRFDAVRRVAAGADGSQVAFAIDAVACEGCGVCVAFCPAGAIAFETVTNGEWYVSQTRCGPMVHACLGAGAENSGKLVTLVRQRARALAAEELIGLVLVDGPPGIGCPVIASLSGADAALIVAEPTAAGLHDFERIAALAAHFDVPAYLCANKWDLDPENAARLEGLAAERGLPCLGRVRYDHVFRRAQRQGRSVLEIGGDGAAEDLRTLWRNLEPLISASETALPVLGSTARA